VIDAKNTRQNDGLVLAGADPRFLEGP